MTVSPGLAIPDVRLDASLDFELGAGTGPLEGYSTSLPHPSPWWQPLLAFSGRPQAMDLHD